MVKLPILIAVLSSIAHAQPTVNNQTLNVTYKGSLSESAIVEHYYNIHYAQDTSGPRRFAPPQPVDPPASGTIIDASKPGAACAQRNPGAPLLFDKPDQIGEDCLSVFIARPAGMNLSPASKLPVLAWIHGGGVLVGSGFDSHINPDKLIDLSIELKQPVIFVGINYRLSIFGFAASDTLREQHSENIGLRDQRLAFEWIKNNIAAFGGDPERVTSYGLSAGGTFTSHHHVAYGGAKGVPFQRAFMMSGPTGTSTNQSKDSVRQNTAAVAERLGCATTGQEMLECLRRVDMQELIDVAYDYAENYHPPLGLHTFVPVVDGDILPDRASKLIHEGKFAKNIPTILAWTEDDGATNIAPASTIQDEAGLIKALERYTKDVLTDAQLSQILDVYPASEFQERADTYNRNRASHTPPVSVHWYRGAAFARDFLFTCSSIDFAHQTYKQTRHSGVNSTFNNVRLYQLNQSVIEPLMKDMGFAHARTLHGSDTNYVFNGVFPEGELGERDVKLSRQFAASLISFAYTGDPVAVNSDETFGSWPAAFTPETRSSTEDDVMPSDVNILVIGGPHGTTAVHLEKDEELMYGVDPVDGANVGDTLGSGIMNRVQQGWNSMQQIIMGVDSVASMESRKAMEAKSELQRQRIFKRCEVINGLAEAFGV